MNGIHRGLLKASGGHLGWTAAGMPVLELTTTGRKSGISRSVLLTSPYQEDHRIVIVASKGGEDTHPSWFLNLLKNPQGEVRLQGAVSSPMLARAASDEEQQRMWPIVTEKYPNYAGYQAKTDRQIPLVILEPVT